MILEFETSISDNPQTCWVCTELGLPRNGIAPGDPHLTIFTGGKVSNRACQDCYDRLLEELDT